MCTLDAFAEFRQVLSTDRGAAVEGVRRSRPSLRSFVEQRREFLLRHAAVMAAGR